jgi:alpha-L-arabinofuranosidase
MANIAQSVNVISPLMTHKDGLVKQASWWPLLLYCKYMHGTTISVHVRCGEYLGPTHPQWIRGTIETPWLDVSAAIDDEGVVTLAVINIDPDRDAVVELQGVSSESSIATYTVNGKSTDATNTQETTEVSISEGSWDGNGPFHFHKHSLTMLRWKPRK